MRAIKAQVRRHFGQSVVDDDKVDAAATNDNNDNGGSTIIGRVVVENAIITSNAVDDDDDNDSYNNYDDAIMESNAEYQYACAAYDRELITLLVRSLRDAFIDIDAEIVNCTRQVTSDDDKQVNTVELF